MIELKINKKTNNAILRKEILEAFPGLGGNAQAVRIFRPTDAKENEQVIQITAGISEKKLQEIIERHQIEGEKSASEPVKARTVEETAKWFDEPPNLKELFGLAEKVEGAREAIAIAMAAQSIFNERRQSQNDEVIKLTSEIETKLQNNLAKLEEQQKEQEKISLALRADVDKNTKTLDEFKVSMAEIKTSVAEIKNTIGNIQVSLRSMEDIKASLRLVLLFKDQIKEAVAKSE